MLKQRKNIFGIVILSLLFMLTASDVYGKFGNGTVEYRLSPGTAPNELIIKIKDPDGIKSFGVRETISGNLLTSGTLGCDPPVLEKEIRIPHQNLDYPISVYFKDCEKGAHDEVWILPVIMGGWTPGVRVWPTDPPRKITWWHILLLILLILLILWLILWWGVFGPFRRSP